MRKHQRIAMLILIAGALCLVSADTALAAEGKKPANASLAFEKLKGLVGRWEATSDKGKVTSTYELVANGTVLLEKFKGPDEGEMVTVYHLDGNNLVLTHYCIAGNQPHMQAEAFDPTSQQIRFAFTGATNLANAGEGHMHTAEIRFLGPDAFNADWTFYKDGKSAFTEQIQFHRVR